MPGTNSKIRSSRPGPGIGCGYRLWVPLTGGGPWLFAVVTDQALREFPGCHPGRTPRPASSSSAVAACPVQCAASPAREGAQCYSRSPPHPSAPPRSLQGAHPSQGAARRFCGGPHQFLFLDPEPRCPLCPPSAAALPIREPSPRFPALRTSALPAYHSHLGKSWGLARVGSVNQLRKM